MVIKVGACRSCADHTEAYLQSKRLPHCDVKVRASGSVSFTYNIAADPRRADPRSLFMQCWRKCGELQFPYHQTMQDGYTIYCSNYR
ncbi:hypothetical protein C8A01DRAFT_16772 [Parachaetomium inaequale]|uniref:Uncharacterized protein n=1 Tax=Parachaetomium inaequale TaxID=2588326 RepID=A0AAN6PHA8_9PEZI|nr:hypothetical protein C8A01DRAFT_16772 [Parachaetomium inaequale]